MTPEQLAEIHAASFTQPRPWSAAEFGEFLASPLCRLVTEENGFALMRKAGPEAELLTIAVHPSARKNGIGRRLLDGVLAAAKADGCEEIHLEVVVDNAAAIALYERAGFTRSGVRKEYYSGPKGQKSSALLMHKSI